MVNRKKLDDIILMDGGDNWWKPELFQQKTLNLLPKELEVLSSPPLESKNYNCFIYVLGLAGNEELIKDSGGFIYDTFFQKLIDENLLSYTNESKDGDYVLYKDLGNHPEMITHIGVKDGEKIISKWAWGPLLKHSILDVPASYGNDVSYIKAIDKEKAEKLYWKYKQFNIKPSVEE